MATGMMPGASTGLGRKPHGILEGMMEGSLLGQGSLWGRGCLQAGSTGSEVSGERGAAGQTQSRPPGLP